MSHGFHDPPVSTVRAVRSDELVNASRTTKRRWRATACRRVGEEDRHAADGDDDDALHFGQDRCVRLLGLPSRLAATARLLVLHPRDGSRSYRAPFTIASFERNRSLTHRKVSLALSADSGKILRNLCRDLSSYLSVYLFENALSLGISKIEEFSRLDFRRLENWYP